MHFKIHTTQDYCLRYKVATFYLKVPHIQLRYI